MLRDNNGDLVFAFATRLQACSVTEVELDGVFHGLKITQNRGFKKLIVESDSHMVVELLNALNVHNHPYQNIIDGIKSIGDAEADFKWRNICCECNSVADLLAKCSLSLQLGCKIYSSPPNFVTQALNSDRVGLGGASV